MLTLPPAEIPELLRGGDTRWIHRAAHDLMGVNPTATPSSAGMPRGRSLYGSIPDQFADDTSFLRQLQAILGCARTTGSPLVDRSTSPRSHNAGCSCSFTNLADEGRYQLTVLNFANEDVAGTVRSKELPPGASVSDMFTGEPIATVDDLHSFAVEMPAHHGMSLLVELDPGEDLEHA